MTETDKILDTIVENIVRETSYDIKWDTDEDDPLNVLARAARDDQRGSLYVVMKYLTKNILLALSDPKTQVALASRLKEKLEEG